MKSNSRHGLLALGLSAVFIRASHADAPVTNIAPSGAAPTVAAGATGPGTVGDSARATAVSPWRDQGVLSTDQVLALVGATVTAEQRAEIEKAVAQRNMAIQGANAQFSLVIFDVLKTDDATLARKMDDMKDRQKMDKMRRFQPSRYQHLQRQKQKERAKD